MLRSLRRSIVFRIRQRLSETRGKHRFGLLPVMANHKHAEEADTWREESFLGIVPAGSHVP